jgi:hypothetical protein
MEDSCACFSSSRAAGLASLSEGIAYLVRHGTVVLLKAKSNAQPAHPADRGTWTSLCQPDERGTIHKTMKIVCDLGS